MSTKTTNFGFNKPELTDAADITQQNKNWDILDAELSKRSLMTITDIRRMGGISVGAETVGAISASLPEYSMLVTQIDSTYNAELRPNNSTSGLLKVTRGVRSKEVIFEFWDFVSTTDVGYYIGVSNAVTQWSGWVKVPKSQDIPIITNGTTDLTEGVSALPTGTLHLVYERGNTV